MKRTILPVSLVALALTAGLLAQDKPNFAGKWTLVPDPNAAAAGGGGGRRGGGFGGGGLGQTFSATQDAKTLVVTTTNAQSGA